MYSLGVLLMWLHTESSRALVDVPVKPVATGVPALDALLPQLLSANPAERPSAAACVAAPYFADTVDGAEESDGSSSDGEGGVEVDGGEGGDGVGVDTAAAVDGVGGAGFVGMSSGGDTDAGAGVGIDASGDGIATATDTAGAGVDGAGGADGGSSGTAVAGGGGGGGGGGESAAGVVTGAAPPSSLPRHLRRRTYGASRRRLARFRRQLYLARSYAQYALANAAPETQDLHWLTVTTSREDVVTQTLSAFATQGLRTNIRVKYVGRPMAGKAGGGVGGGVGVDVDGDGLMDIVDGERLDGVGDGWLLGVMMKQFFHQVVYTTNLFTTCLERSGPAEAVAAHGVARSEAKKKWRLSGMAGADIVFMPSPRANSPVRACFFQPVGW